MISINATVGGNPVPTTEPISILKDRIVSKTLDIREYLANGPIPTPGNEPTSGIGVISEIHDGLSLVDRLLDDIKFEILKLK